MSAGAVIRRTGDPPMSAGSAIRLHPVSRFYGTRNATPSPLLAAGSSVCPEADSSGHRAPGPS